MQVNQNVNAANFLLVSSQTTAPIATREETTDGMDFASVLKNTNDTYPYQNDVQVAKNQNASSVAGSESASNSSKDMADSNEVKTEERSSVETQDAHNSKTAKKDEVATKEVKETESENSQKVDEAAEKSSVEQEKEIGEEIVVIDGMENLSEEDLSILLETVGNLLQNVMEQFGLTADELTAKLEEFGMETSDLFTQEGLKEFFLQMNDAAKSDLIVSEELNTQLQNFLSETSEELKVLETVTTDVEMVLSEEDIQSVIKQLMPKEEADGMVQQTVADEVVEPTNNEPDVIVTNEKSQESSNSENTANNTNSNSDKQQQESVLKQTTKQETTVTTDGATSKQNTFENPILQAIQNAVNNVEATVTAEQPVQQTDVVRQIVEQVRVNMNQQTTSLELQLYPEHLGRIQINVVSKDGVLTASIVAETEAAKQAIEGGLLNLKEAMQQQDLKVEAIEVMVSTMGFEKGEEQQQSFDEKGSSNPRRKIDLSELGETVPVEDEAEIEKMKATGSSVSYRA